MTAQVKTWTREVSGNFEVYGLKVGDIHAGFVTVDFKARGFRYGQAFLPGPLDSEKEYVGKGWRERLINDARRALESVAASYENSENERG